MLPKETKKSFYTQHCLSVRGFVCVCGFFYFYTEGIMLMTVSGWRVGWIVLHDRRGLLAAEIKPALFRLCTILLGANTLAQSGASIFSIFLFLLLFSIFLIF